MDIRINLNSFKATTALPYLGRTATYNNSDWASFYINLSNDQRGWGMVEKVMGNTVVPIKGWDMM